MEQKMKNMTQLRNRPVPIQVPRNKINIVSAEEFVKEQISKIPWVIHNMFEKGTTNMLSAAPNNFKSWIALEIAICISSGSPLFGIFGVNDVQRVWIINEEDTRAGIQARLNMFTNKWSKLPIYLSIQNQITLNDSYVDEIIAEAEKRGVEFIIFDSLRSMHEADENSSTEMQRVMNQLKKITSHGITVLFTHHNRKKGMYTKSGDPEDSRGSSAINAAIHSHLSCEPKVEDGVTYLRITQPKLKGDKKMEPFKIKVDLNNPEGLLSFVGFGEEAPHKKISDKIMRILSNAGTNGINFKQLVSQEVAGERTLRQVLKEMEEQKLIISKKWNEIKKDKSKDSTDGEAHNEKFYFLYPSSIETK